MEVAEYSFTVDWFTQHVPIWSQIIDQKQPERVVEIGAYEGRSTCYLIEQGASHRPMEIWSIDTWEGGVENDPNLMGEVERRFDHNIAFARAKACHPVEVTKIKSRSNLALASLLAAGGRSSMDLIYVDGSHQAPDVLSDAVMAFPLLKIGGVMIFDDYLWCMEAPNQKDPINMPKLGVDAFINVFLRKVNILAGAPIYQLYIEKIDE